MRHVTEHAVSLSRPAAWGPCTASCSCGDWPTVHAATAQAALSRHAAHAACKGPIREDALRVGDDVVFMD